MSLDDKRARATHVIDNSGDQAATRGQLVEVWRSLTGQPLDG